MHKEKYIPKYGNCALGKFQSRLAMFLMMGPSQSPVSDNGSDRARRYTLDVVKGKFSIILLPNPQPTFNVPTPLYTKNHENLKS